jgi:4-amino-4-deoxy-L-arabinose transferase-like glycosyltransferase
VRTRIVVAGVLALAAAIRVPQLGETGLWNDETIIGAVSERSLGELMNHVRFDVHPPLYFVMSWGVRQLAGPDRWDEAMVRALPLAFGLLGVWLAYRVGRRLVSPGAGMVAALLLAVNPMHVHYSREARNYSLVVVLALVAIAAAAELLARPNVRNGLLTGVACLALMYTHNLALFLIAAIFAAMVLVPRRRLDRARLLALGVAALALVLGYLPWVTTFLHQAAQISTGARGSSGAEQWLQPNWEAQFPWQIPISIGAMSSGGPPPVHNFVRSMTPAGWLAAGISLAAVAAGLSARSRWRHPEAAPLLLVTSAGPLLLLFAVSVVHRPIYSPGRADVIALPAFILLVAASVRMLPDAGAAAASHGHAGAIPRRAGAWQLVLALAVGGLVALSLAPIGRELSTPKGDTDRAWANEVAASTRDGDVFVVTGLWRTKLEYYLARDHRRLRLLGFPCARDLHPSWFGWSGYDAAAIRSEAAEVAGAAARLASSSSGSVWVACGANPGSADSALLSALSQRLERVAAPRSPTLGGSPYHVFRASPQVRRERRESPAPAVP